MARLTDALQLGGAETRFIGAPGWVATRASLADAAAQLSSIRVTSDDTVVIDLWSNSAYMGTDEYGLPVRASKAGDGRYHIVGTGAAFCTKTDVQSSLLHSTLKGECNKDSGILNFAICLFERTFWIGIWDLGSIAYKLRQHESF